MKKLLLILILIFSTTSVKADLCAWGTWVESSRWSGLEQFIRDVAYSHNLKLQIETNAGVLHKDIKFKVYGDCLKVFTAKNEIEEALKNYKEGY